MRSRKRHSRRCTQVYIRVDLKSAKHLITILKETVIVRNGRRATVVIVSSVNAFEYIVSSVSFNFRRLALSFQSFFASRSRGSSTTAAAAAVGEQEERYIILRFVTILFIPCHKRAHLFTEYTSLPSRSFSLSLSRVEISRGH